MIENKLIESFFSIMYDTKPVFVPPENLESIISLPLQARAIILSANTHNFHTYKQNPIFQAILDSLDSANLDSMPDVQAIQAKLLSISTPSELQNLKPFLLRLNTAELLSTKITRALYELFDKTAIEHQHEHQHKKHLNLTALKEALQDFKTKIIEFSTLPQTPQHINQALTNMHNQKFSIGVTGVLSAGKSTFLNALLQEEILGTSTIPETANLTILKYAKDKKARIHFWSKEQWEELCQMSELDANLKDFIAQTKEVFKNRLESILAESYRDIPINEISTYTSANNQSKFCNLVQKVEVFTPLKFLKNRVEIVDTPGLDDPVIKREEITKEYIKDCDLLIHIMNASCAATQVDIDFILESLLSQNIARLLIVLTRADLLTQSDLEQSMQYTKTSLANQLEKSKYDGDVQALLGRIDFIAFAGFYAVLHTTGRSDEALKAGYDLERTGLNEVESYLDMMLTGENSLKNKDIIFVAYKRFAKAIQAELEGLDMAIQILQASKQEVQGLIDIINAKNTALLNDLDAKTAHLQSQKKRSSNLSRCACKNYQHHTFKPYPKATHPNLDDVNYEHNRGKKPTYERILGMIGTHLNDVFIDISRDYTFKITKHISYLLESITVQSTQPPRITHLYTTSQIKQLALNLTESVFTLIAHFNKNSFKAQLYDALNTGFESFKNLFSHKNQQVSQQFLQYFDDIIKQQQDSIHVQIAQTTQNLQNALSKAQSVNSPEHKDQLLAKQQALIKI